MTCNNKTNQAYVNMPFCSKTAMADFYSYSTVADIVSKSEEVIHKTFKCRTIGILESIHGQFYLSDFRKASSEELIKLRVSTCYVKSPLQSSVKPYPVQIFGTVYWKREPILFAMIIQVLPTRTAVGVSNVINRIAQNFIAAENIPENGTDEHGCLRCKR